LTSAFIKPKRKHNEQGFILLVLMLFVAVLTISAIAIAPSIVFEVRRDHEEELIHRGVQYSRAVQHYYKKFKRYPTRVEDLESSNNLRFLRKRYKDPITGQDFKLLYLSDVPAALGPGLAGGGLTPAANAGNQFGQTANGFGAGNFGATAQPSSNSAANPPAATAPPASPDATSAGVAAAGNNGSPDQSTPGTSTTSSPTQSANQPGGSKSPTDKLAGQTFGGGPIVGVVSTSKKESIRVFNKENHYNKWLFIYNPQMDRGGLLNTPNQPALQGATPVGQPVGAGAAGQSGTPGSPFGNQGLGNQGSPFGSGQQQPPQNTQPQPEQ
jgi:type II secretory pathway pseudopilin PulG